MERSSSRRSSASPVPSARLTHRSKFPPSKRFERNTTDSPSGVHRGILSSASWKVSRERGPCGSSFTQMSWLPSAWALRARRCPSGDRNHPRSRFPRSKDHPGSTGLACPERVTHTNSCSSWERPPVRYIRSPEPDSAMVVLPIRPTAKPSVRDTAGPVTSSRSASKGAASSVPSAVTYTRCPEGEERANTPRTRTWCSPVERSATAMSYWDWSVTGSRKMVKSTPLPLDNASGQLWLTSDCVESSVVNGEISPPVGRTRPRPSGVSR